MVELLFIDKKDLEVKLTTAGKEVKSFQEAVKSIDKKFFNDMLTFIFYVYNTTSDDNPYRSIPIKDRIVDICKQKFDEPLKPNHFLKHKYVENCIREYNKLTKTRTFRFMEQLFLDMDNTIDDLNKLPKTKLIIIELEVNQGTEEKPDMVTIKREVEFDNTKERISMYKQVSEILELKKKYSLMLKEEEYSGLEDETQYMFDKMK